MIFTPRECGWKAEKVGQETNELISSGPSASGLKQLDLLLQTELQPPKESRIAPIPSALVVVKQREKGHGGGDRAGFHSDGEMEMLT